MADVTQLGQAGLKGWRAKVGDRIAPALAGRTGLTEAQVRGLIGATFFGLSVMYVAKTIRSAAAEIRRS